MEVESYEILIPLKLGAQSRTFLWVLTAPVPGPVSGPPPQGGQSAQETLPFSHNLAV